MEETVQSYLAGARLENPQQYRNLTLVPVAGGHRDPFDYLTLGEALREGSFEVREVSEGGSVPELRVVNRSERMVLILDGEALVGAKQNRIVNTTILVAAKSETVIPVSCVEQGRWTYQTQTFQSKDRVSHPAIRQRKAADVASSLKASGRFQADQGAVWQEVSFLASRRAALSPSMDMNFIYEKEARALKGYLDHFHRVEGQIGAFFLVNGELAGMDAFGKPDAFARQFRKLLESYALDAVDRYRGEADPSRGLDAPKGMLEKAGSARTEARPSVALGRDIRLEGEGLIGFALEFEGFVLHLCLFPERGGRSEGEDFSRLVRLSTRRRSRGL